MKRLAMTPFGGGRQQRGHPLPLEGDGLVNAGSPQKSPRLGYTLTNKARSLQPAFE